MRHVIAVLLLSFAACATMTEEELLVEEKLQGENTQVDVFVARGHLTGADFERFVVKGSVVWKECGSVDKRAVPRSAEGQPSSQNLIPALTLEDSQVERISAELRRRVNKRSLKIFEFTDDDDLPSPGGVFDLTSTGVFECQIQVAGETRRFVTSFDAVARKQNTLLRQLHFLYAGLRNIGDLGCGRENFFGVRRERM